VKWINPDGAHQRKIDQEPAVTNSVARDVMAAAAHSDQEAVLTRKPYGTNDVCGPSAAHDRAWVAVDHRIPDRARFVIARLLGQTDVASQGLAKGSNCIAFKRNRPALQRGQPDLRHGILRD